MVPARSARSARALRLFARGEDGREDRHQPNAVRNAPDTTRNRSGSGLLRSLKAFLTRFPAAGWARHVAHTEAWLPTPDVDREHAVPTAIGAVDGPLLDGRSRPGDARIDLWRTRQGKKNLVSELGALVSVDCGPSFGFTHGL